MSSFQPFRSSRHSRRRALTDSSLGPRDAWTNLQSQRNPLFVASSSDSGHEASSYPVLELGFPEIEAPDHAFLVSSLRTQPVASTSVDLLEIRTQSPGPLHHPSKRTGDVNPSLNVSDQVNVYHKVDMSHDSLVQRLEVSGNFLCLPLAPQATQLT